MRRLIERLLNYLRNMGHRILYIPKPKDQGVKYGLLYNWYAASDSRNIAPAGWRLISDADINAIHADHGFLTGGGKFKETGYVYWNSPNTGATNELGFNARGAGRVSDAGFSLLTMNLFLWVDSDYGGSARHLVFGYNNTMIGTGSSVYINGISIRLVKETTSLSNGETGIMYDNNGREYLTICISGIEWMAENLRTTKYRNGDVIPEVTNLDDWIVLETGAIAAYNNDWSNV